MSVGARACETLYTTEEEILSHAAEKCRSPITYRRGVSVLDPPDTELNPHTGRENPAQMGYAVSGGSCQCCRGLYGATLSARLAGQLPGVDGCDVLK